MNVWDSIHSVEELLQLFHNEAEINSFLFHMKWPSGFVCPRCHHGEAYVIKTRRLPLYDCRACRHQTSLIAGTIMEEAVRRCGSGLRQSGSSLVPTCLSMRFNSVPHPSNL